MDVDRRFRRAMIVPRRALAGFPRELCTMAPAWQARTDDAAVLIRVLREAGVLGNAEVQTIWITARASAPRRS